MTFPNALEGVKKIYKAEIIALVSGILAVVAGFLALVGLAAGTAGSGEGALAGLLSGGLLIMVCGILAIIAFILNIVGLVKAKPDDENFKNALIVVLIGIVSAIVVSASEGNGLLGDLGQTVSDICSFLTTYFVCSAIINLAGKLENSIIKQKAVDIRKMVMIIWWCTIALDILNTIFGKFDGNTVMTYVTGVIGVFTAILSVISYVLYLKLLSKARTMLEA